MDLDKNIDEIRAQFPHFNYITHFGSAGSAPLCLKWYNAIQEYWKIVRAGSRLGGGNVHSFLGPKTIEAKLQAAKLINADPSEVAWVARCCQGFNLIKDIIDYNSPFQKGDNIVFSDQDYPSGAHSWLGLRKRGVEPRQVKHVNGQILLSDFEKAIDEKTKLVSVNRTTWHLGFTHDVAAVCKIAHEKGAYVVDDAFQSIGAIKVDVHKDDVDFLISGSYKWQCGPPEAGIFYVRKDLCEKLEPPHWSYLNVDRGPWTMEQRINPVSRFPFGEPDHDNLKSYDMPFYKTAERFEEGISTYDVMWGWYETLKWLNELGSDNIQARCRKVASYMADRLLDIGCKVNTPMDDKTTLDNLHLLNYTTGSHDKDKKCTELMAAAPKPIMGPSMRYQGGIGGIRICPHFFNTEQEIDTFIEFQRNLMM